MYVTQNQNIFKFAGRIRGQNIKQAQINADIHLQDIWLLEYL